jgi:hypothetical protein
MSGYILGVSFIIRRECYLCKYRFIKGSSKYGYIKHCSGYIHEYYWENIFSSKYHHNGNYLEDLTLSFG